MHHSFLRTSLQNIRAWKTKVWDNLGRDRTKALEPWVVVLIGKLGMEDKIKIAGFPDPRESAFFLMVAEDVGTDEHGEPILYVNMQKCAIKISLVTCKMPNFYNLLETICDVCVCNAPCRNKNNISTDKSKLVKNFEGEGRIEPRNPGVIKSVVFVEG